MVKTDTKIYRGRTLEEVLPKIKAELGPDAEIVRQRSGLAGGIGGFFQREMVEVEARPASGSQAAGRRPQGRRFDAYDDEPAVPEPEAPEDFIPDEPPVDEPTAEGLSTPGIQEILRQATPFAEQLGAAERQLGSGEPPPATSDLPPATPFEEKLVEEGIDPAVARELMAEVTSHELPFASKRAAKRVVRAALARRIPVAPGAPAGARSIAFVGPGGSGKTLVTARLAAAYASGSDLAVVVIALRSVDDGAELAAVLEPLGIGVRAADSGDQARAYLAGAVAHALVAVDTPAVAPRSAAEVAALGSELEALGVGEVHMTLPSTYSKAAARELIGLLAPLRASRIALTHMDETTHVGGLVDCAIGQELPISYLSEGTGVPGGLEPAAADKLAALVLQ
jgi:Meckel syndrome type 1 protein